MDNNIYCVEPKCMREGIPVFSNFNEYIENYEKISADHISHLMETGKNPFISEELWLASEQSTIALIEKFSFSGAKILDVGVGLGRVLSNFPSLKKYGMDISFDYLKIARNQGIQVCLSMVEDMPYQMNFFDVVVCTDVLEHVFDLFGATQKILSVLKPQGILIVRVPFKEDLSSYLSTDNPYEFVHLRNFDEFSLRLHFEKIFTCKVLQITYAGYIHSSERLKYRFPFIDKLLLKCLSLFKRFNSKLYTRLQEKFFNPVEINIVLQK